MDIDCSGCYQPLMVGGVLTDYGIRTYLHGNCWQFAWALSEIVSNADLFMCGNQDTWRHVVVSVGNGYFMDAQGLATENELYERWGMSLNPVTGLAAIDYQTYYEYLDPDDSHGFDAGMAETVQVAQNFVKTYIK